MPELKRGITMADEEKLATTLDADAEIKAAEPAPKKPKPVQKPVAKTRASRGKGKPEEVAPVEAPQKRRRYSEAERADKLTAIDAAIGKGTTLKAAAKSAGVTDQTYYQWKKAAKAPVTAKPETASIAFADLAELEAENQRLRTLLAEKLRTENEELRKRIGQQ